MNNVIKTYNLIDGINLTLSKDALNHIIYGDINTKPVEMDGRRVTKKVLAGGLHSVSGWDLFKQEHTNVKHLYDYRSDVDEDWFYARELQNEVILLKLPSTLMTSKAAKMTKFPENYYKSGYLWKTLFPVYVDESNFVGFLDEVLENINYRESSGGELVGYMNCSEPLRMIRVSVLHRDGKINSVYPSWSQPNTGNNGKPFSYFDNIGHFIASSTVLYDRTEDHNLFNNSMFLDARNIKDICARTPEIFLERTSPSNDLDEWRRSRVRELKAYAAGANEDDIYKIYNYLTDGVIFKENYFYFNDLLNHFGFDALSNIKEINSILYTQNIIDGLYVIYFSCLAEKLFKKLVSFLLKSMVTHVLIDCWNKRRIHLCIMKLCRSSGDSEIIKQYLRDFASSPTRREVFVEYDYESLEKRKAYANGFELSNLPQAFIIMKRPPVNRCLNMDDFIHFTRDNLGESYSYALDEKMRNKILDDYMSEDHLSKVIKLNLRYISEKDFLWFGFEFGTLIDEFISSNSEMDFKVLSSIVRDYCKIQFAQRFRTNLNYKEYSEIDPLPYNDVGDEYIYALTLKHERISNHLRVEEFLKQIQKMSKHYGNQNLDGMITEYHTLNGKERPSLPHDINIILEDLKGGGIK